MRLPTLFVLTLIFATNIATAAERITVDDVSFALPDNWHEVKNPKGGYMAMPEPHDGRLFGFLIEPSKTAPLPCEIDNQSSFETGFWKSFEATFASHSHTTVIDHDFSIINGVPFRIIKFERDNPAGKSYGECAVAVGNGHVYSIMLAKMNQSPAGDRDLQPMLNSVTFTSPLRPYWYQPLLHYFSDLIGLPLLLAALGCGSYGMAIQPVTIEKLKRKQIMIMLGLVFGMLNGTFIAGLDCATGIISILFAAILILQQVSVNKRIKAAMASGTIPTPTPQQFNRATWILAGSFGLGAVTSYFWLTYSGMPQWITIPSVSLTAIFCGGVLWWARIRQRTELQSAQPTKKADA